ncbi:MAG: hypothetical protein PSV22_08440 [Pseudolabrys sp.]|nr:hypothetical protein [Pseudolabrys sp.]
MKFNDARKIAERRFWARRDPLWLRVAQTIARAADHYRQSLN